MSIPNQNFIHGLTDFIQDFRKRVFLIFALLLTGTIIGYYKANIAMTYLFNRVDIVIFISPTEGFIAKLKIAFVLGIILTIPIILHIILSFIKRRFIMLSIKHTLVLTVISYLLFLIGSAFAIFIILPLGLTFLLGFATPDMQPMLSAGRYVSFATLLLLVFGITFQMPLIINILSKSGMITSTTLKEKRKYIIIGMFVLAGFLTPPDIVSQILLAVPLLFLYEISIFLAQLREKKLNKEGLPPTPKEDGPVVTDEMMDEFIGKM